MTLSDREVGELQERLKQLEHRARNDRTALNLLEGEIGEIENRLNKLMVQVYTSIGAILMFSTVVGWVVSILMRTGT